MTHYALLVVGGLIWTAVMVWAAVDQNGPLTTGAGFIAVAYLIYAIVTKENP
jgi:hypothetical protein